MSSSSFTSSSPSSSLPSSSSTSSSSLSSSSDGSSHPTMSAKRPKVNRACAECKESHTACDSNRPCSRCVSLGLGEFCRDAECKKRGRPKKVKRTARGAPSMPNIINVAMPNGINFGSPLMGMPFSPLQPFGAPSVLPHHGGGIVPGPTGGFHPYTQLPTMQQNPVNPAPSPTTSIPASTSSSFSYPSPLSTPQSSFSVPTPTPASSLPAQVKVQAGGSFNPMPATATGHHGGMPHSSSALPSQNGGAAPLRAGHHNISGASRMSMTPTSPDDGYSGPTLTHSSSPPSDASPSMPTAVPPTGYFPQSGVMSGAGGSIGSDNPLLMSALNSLLNEIKDLKETTRELKKETLNLKNEQVLLREQFSTYITSQAANLAHLQQQRSSTTNQTTSSSSSTSSAPSLSQCTALSTPQPRMPMVKGMPYIAVEGIHVPSFVIRNPNKPLVFVLRKKGLNGILAAVNYAFCQLFQYEMDEIVGCSWQKLVAPGESSRLLHLVIPFLKRFNKTYSPVLTIQPRCLTKDGTPFKAVTRHQFFYDSVGRPVWSAIALEGVILTGEEMKGNYTHIHQVRQAMGLDNWSEEGPTHTSTPHAGFPGHDTLSTSDLHQPPSYFSNYPQSSAQQGFQMYQQSSSAAGAGASVEEPSISTTTMPSASSSGGVPLGEPVDSAVCTGIAIDSAGRYSWAWMPPATPPAFISSSPQLAMFEDD